MVCHFIGKLIAGAGFAALALSLSTSSWAADLTDAQAKTMFNDKGCNACHGVDELRIGPSYRDIATRYADGPINILELLALKIRHGGAGAWGIVPMVSNPNVSPDEADALARWILKQQEDAQTR